MSYRRERNTSYAHTEIYIIFYVCHLTRSVFSRTKRVILEITMHLTAVVLILVVTGIAKGNLRFSISPLRRLTPTQRDLSQFRGKQTLI